MLPAICRLPWLTWEFGFPCHSVQRQWRPACVMGLLMTPGMTVCLGVRALGCTLVSAPGTFQPCCGSLCAAPPHRTDCCRPIRRRGGVKGAFEYTLTRHFPPYSLPCGQSQPLTPYRRSIAIRRQSGGGPLHFPGHAAVARPSPSNINTRASAGEQRRWLDHPSQLADPRSPGLPAVSGERPACYQIGGSVRFGISRVRIGRCPFPVG